MNFTNHFTSNIQKVHTKTHSYNQFWLKSDFVIL